MGKDNYKRDGRAPIPVNEVTSRVMRSNKGKDTKPELLLRKTLWAYQIRGYRLHWKKAPGKPDIAFPKRKLAIFINGCFWHRCPHCDLSLPKSNTEFWEDKFNKNIERDKKNMASLKEAGWQVVVIWECQIKKDLPEVVRRIRKELKKS